MAKPLIPIFTDLAQAQQTVLRRAAWDEQDVPDVVRDGIRRRFGEELTPAAAVARVLNDVRQRGEAAALEWTQRIDGVTLATFCLLYTSDAADERSSVDLGGRRIIKKKTRE